MIERQLYYTKAIYGEPERQAVNRVLDSEWLSGYKETVLFERELAAWWKMKYAISCNSGSMANFLALDVLDLEEGSEVITPAGGAFPTTISPIVYHRLTPVFVDIDLKTLCLDLDEVEKAISPKTKAIMFAHTLGFMPDMERLMEIAGSHKLKVLEDACDAVGSKQGDKMAGSFGDLATVSFYPAHHLTTGGEGGAILTNHPEYHHALRSTRDWGRDCQCEWGKPTPTCGDRYRNPPFDHRYYYTRLGLNNKMTEMQAAFGREQLKRLDDFIAKRKRNYRILAERLGTAYNEDISPFAYPLMVDNKEKVMEALNSVGIHTRTLFGGNILEHPAYKNIRKRVIGNLPNSQRLLNEAFFVGVGPHLTEEDMNCIADCLEKLK